MLDLVRKNDTKPVKPNVRYDDKHGLWRTGTYRILRSYFAYARGVRFPQTSVADEMHS